MRAPSGWEPFRRVTGDLPRRYLSLVEAPAGSGKTRAMLRVAGGVVRTMRRPVLYACVEQSISLVRSMAEANGVTADELGPGGVAFLPGLELEQVAAAARELRAALVVVDAFKPSTFGGSECIPGSQAEKAATLYLLKLAGDIDGAIALMLHFTGDGTRASVGSAPRQNAELVVSLQKLAEPLGAIELACGLQQKKNRTWPDHHTALLRMGARGELLTHEKDGV